MGVIFPEQSLSGDVLAVRRTGALAEGRGGAGGEALVPELLFQHVVDDEVVRDVHEPAAVDGHIGIETVKGSVDDVVEFMCDDEYGLMQRKRGKERRRNKHASGGRNGRRLNARVKAYVHDRKWLDGVGEQRLDQCERRLQFVCCVVVVQGVALIMSSKVLTSALSAPSSAHCCT